jgi:hypothetical protein
MKRNRRMNKLIFLVIIMTTVSGYSQTKATKSAKNESAPEPIKLDRSKITKRIKLQFDEDLVKGNAENTELNFIQTRRDNNFKKMIKIRENFIPEIEDGITELGSK